MSLFGQCNCVPVSYVYVNLVTWVVSVSALWFPDSLLQGLLLELFSLDNVLQSPHTCRASTVNTYVITAGCLCCLSDRTGRKYLSSYINIVMNQQGGPGSQEPLRTVCGSIGCFREGFCSVGGSRSLGEEGPCCMWQVPFGISVCLREAAVCWAKNNEDFWFNITACLC